MSDELSELFSGFDGSEEMGEETAEFSLKARGTSTFREKYRPQQLGEIIPTCSIELLRNQIDNPNASHIYLFDGPTGTGKTTSARILAKALNCLTTNSFDKPCLTCNNCRSYEKSFDKIELNSANQNKVEDIRQLVEDMRYAPAVYSKKIYILDEVQRLTSAAQQVLLTELEEPHSFLTVFLCTTNIKEIDKALVDRSCRITFDNLNAKNARSAILQVLKNENLSATDDIITSFYLKSRGSVRALLNNIEAYAQKGYQPDQWEEDEVSAEVKTFFSAIVSGDWPSLTLYLKKYNVRKEAETLRYGLENYMRAVILNTSSLEEASLLGTALVRISGSLIEESRVASQYNLFVLKCLRACNVFKNKKL